MKFTNAVIFATALVELASAQALHRHGLVRIRRQAIIGTSQVDASAVAPPSSSVAVAQAAASEVQQGGNGVQIVTTGSSEPSAITSASSVTASAEVTTESNSASASFNTLDFGQAAASVDSVTESVTSTSFADDSRATTSERKRKGSKNKGKGRGNDRSTTVGDDGVETVFVQATPTSTVTLTTFFRQFNAKATRKAKSNKEKADQSEEAATTTAAPTRMVRRRL